MKWLFERIWARCDPLPYCLWLSLASQRKMILLTLNLVPGKPGLCVWAHGILLIHGNLAFWVGTHHIFCEFSLRQFLIIRLKLCLLDKMTVHLTLCFSECHVGALDVLVLACYWYWLGSLEQGDPLVPGCWLISRLAFFKHFGPGTPLHSLKILQSTTELPPLPSDTDMVCVR